MRPPKNQRSSKFALKAYDPFLSSLAPSRLGASAKVTEIEALGVISELAQIRPESDPLPYTDNLRLR